MKYFDFNLLFKILQSPLRVPFLDSLTKLNEFFVIVHPRLGSIHKADSFTSEVQLLSSQESDHIITDTIYKAYLENNIVLPTDIINEFKKSNKNISSIVLNSMTNEQQTENYDNIVLFIMWLVLLCLIYFNKIELFSQEVVDVLNVTGDTTTIKYITVVEDQPDIRLTLFKSLSQNNQSQILAFTIGTTVITCTLLIIVSVKILNIFI